MNRTRILSLTLVLAASAVIAGDASARGPTIKIGGSSSSSARGSNTAPGGTVGSASGPATVTGSGNTGGIGAAGSSIGGTKSPAKSGNGGNGNGGTTVIIGPGSSNGGSGAGISGPPDRAASIDGERKPVSAPTAAPAYRSPEDCARIGDPERREDCARATSRPPQGSSAGGSSWPDLRGAPAPTVIRGSNTTSRNRR